MSFLIFILEEVTLGVVFVLAGLREVVSPSRFLDFDPLPEDLRDFSSAI
jgi:hypothetical protein